MSTYVFVVISPPTTTSPVVISVSQATRPAGSSASTASRTASEIWSATLSGWPSVTDSEVARERDGVTALGRSMRTTGCFIFVRELLDAEASSDDELCTRHVAGL